MPSRSDQKPKKPHFVVEILVGGLSVLAIVIIACQSAFTGSTLDAQNAAQFGDFIGGFIGTILLVLSGCLVISAYRLQGFVERIRSYEAHFFEMLKYHRDNMMEIDVDGIKGRRAFVSFIREWRLALDVVDRAAERSGYMLEVGSRARLAYFAFFHGSGPNSQANLRKVASSYPESLVDLLIAEMSRVWYEESRAPLWGERVLMMLGRKSSSLSLNGRPKRLSYVPFEGHHSRLAHYYRHLFQLVRHVDQAAPEGTEQSHIDLVRAQLSTHELALLGLHAYAMNDQWLDSNYLVEYKLLRDLPPDFLLPSEFPIDQVYCDKTSPMPG